jgi:cystathionine gamma-synthase
MYWALRKWLLDLAEHGRIQLAFYDNADIADVERQLAAAPTRLLWVETPANPTWELTDIRAAAALARQHGAMTLVDSTVATPVLCQPLALGADIVLHSATKYLNGHSDVVAGALVTREDSPLWQRIRVMRNLGGAILGPFEAWLLLRGMRTLHLRVRAACANALQLATELEQHPAIAQVLYPGLPSHPQHATAVAQMNGGFGGMLSIRLRDGEGRARDVAARVQVFKRATSLGSVESLIEHRASVEGPGSRCPTDLLRLSVGIEPVADLLADLTQALGG